jgi:hypothetical protein
VKSNKPKSRATNQRAENTKEQRTLIVKKPSLRTTHPFYQEIWTPFTTLIYTTSRKRITAPLATTPYPRFGDIMRDTVSPIAKRRPNSFVPSTAIILSGRVKHPKEMARVVISIPPRHEIL